MNLAFKRAARWFVVTCLAALLSACYTLAGLDMSVEGRHKMWVQDRKNCIGNAIASCPYWYHENVMSTKSYPGLFLGEFNLKNENIERGFRYGRFDLNNPSRFPQCRYFYEYDPKTGVIVGFRFEGSERFACRISGA
jgi:hypothetical protein